MKDQPADYSTFHKTFTKRFEEKEKKLLAKREHFEKTQTGIWKQMSKGGVEKNEIFHYLLHWLKMEQAGAELCQAQFSLGQLPIN